MNSNPQSAVAKEVESWGNGSLPGWAKWVTAGGFVLAAATLGAKTTFDSIQAAQQKHEHDYTANTFGFFVQSVERVLRHSADQNDTKSVNEIAKQIAEKNWAGVTEHPSARTGQIFLNPNKNEWASQDKPLIVVKDFSGPLSNETLIIYFRSIDWATFNTYSPGELEKLVPWIQSAQPFMPKD